MDRSRRSQRLHDTELRCAFDLLVGQPGGRFALGKGTVLFDRGDRTVDFFIVLEGRIEINSAGQAAVYLSHRASCVHVLVRGSGLAASMSDHLIGRIAASKAMVHAGHTRKGSAIRNLSLREFPRYREEPVMMCLRTIRPDGSIRAMVLKLISVNVGLPRQVVWKRKQVLTGIFKEPVAQRLQLRRLNLDGDQQADLSVHGGADKAVYVYPAEHYEYWRGELAGMQLPWGMFGENFTTEGLLETAVHIGDRFRIGEAEVMVTQPRMPCYKLGLKFGRDDIIKRFLNSGLTGFYFAVRREGAVTAGDLFEPVGTNDSGVTVEDITRLYVSKKDDVQLLRRAVQAEALAEGWRGYFQHRLDKLNG